MEQGIRHTCGGTKCASDEACSLHNHPHYHPPTGVHLSTAVQNGHSAVISQTIRPAGGAYHKWGPRGGAGPEAGYRAAGPGVYPPSGPRPPGYAYPLTTPEQLREVDPFFTGDSSETSHYPGYSSRDVPSLAHRTYVSHYTAEGEEFIAVPSGGNGEPTFHRVIQHVHYPSSHHHSPHRGPPPGHAYLPLSHAGGGAYEDYHTYEHGGYAKVVTSEELSARHRSEPHAPNTTTAPPNTAPTQIPIQHTFEIKTSLSLSDSDKISTDVEYRTGAERTQNRQPILTEDNNNSSKVPQSTSLSQASGDITAEINSKGHSVPGPAPVAPPEAHQTHITSVSTAGRPESVTTTLDTAPTGTSNLNHANHDMQPTKDGGPSLIKEHAATSLSPGHTPEGTPGSEGSPSDSPSLCRKDKRRSLTGQWPGLNSCPAL